MPSILKERKFRPQEFNLLTTISMIREFRVQREQVLTFAYAMLKVHEPIRLTN